MASIPELKTLEDLNVVRRRNIPYVLWFGATWCGPCRRMKVSADSIAETARRAGFALYYCDVDEAKDIAAGMSVRRVPSFVRAEPGQPPVLITETYPHAVCEFINYKALEAAQHRS
jgi:thiol-disulfide isomerase/thioredoxin